MRKTTLISFLALFIILYGISCQDKYLVGYNLNSSGSLKSDAGGNCLPKTINGTFIAEKTLNDSNFLELTVAVTKTGNYQIRSNTVNGFSFSGSGKFGSAGLNTIRLAATGKPLTAGISDFTISYDTSQCLISINVLPVGSNSSTPAVYTISGDPVSCIHAQVNGSYVKNNLLDTFSKISVQVNVSAVGSYTLSTNNVNGYSFSGSGVFTQTGLQTASIFASGTPLNAGVDQFKISGNSSSCTIPITVLESVPITNNDHFPLATNNYWNYDDLLNTGDTLNETIIDSTRINGILYKVLEEKTKYGSPTQSYYRRVDSTYFKNVTVDDYTVALKFSPQIIKEVPILREYLVTGDKWYSEEYIGPASFQQVIYLRYEFNCTDANATVTVNGKTFVNVYKIQLKPQIRSAITYPYSYTNETLDFWYAKGIGLIYYKRVKDSYSIYEKQIRNWTVR